MANPGSTSLTSLRRRGFMQRAARWAIAAPLAARLALAGAAAPQSPRFALLILRGGMDGLSAVPAPGDPSFAAARGALAQFDSEPIPGRPGSADPPRGGHAEGVKGVNSAPLPLAAPFALHPALAQAQAMYGRGELALVHATGWPYRERSHFDAQQLLESGGTRPFALADGWLGRALAGGHSTGLALQSAVPLVLRGHAGVDTWAPSVLPEPAPDLVARLTRMYAGDAALARALERARELREHGMGATGMAAAPAPGRALVALAERAAQFLARPDGPQVAVLEMGGWDTHANQVAPQGPLGNALRTLDAALAALRDGLLAGDAWSRSVVLVVTEFGREVAINGTQGTDHGSGGVALLAGGAVRGGQVIADWPGLAPADRFEGRDLRITTDLRAVLRTVLHRHLELPLARLDSEVLPGSGGLAMLPLLRG